MSKIKAGLIFSQKNDRIPNDSAVSAISKLFFFCKLRIIALL